MPRPTARVPVLKTHKLFLGGKFVRSESGRVATARAVKGEARENYALASRKDFRDAVVAARNAIVPWGKMSPYLRGQILYRAAEMLEPRRQELAHALIRGGLSRTKAAREVSATIDCLVYYAGWTDKFAALFGSVNPVATSHFNFTFPEPMGVVAVVAPDEPALLGFVSAIAPAIVSGNAVVAIASGAQPLPALTLAEILATSDLPGGVVNILAGDLKSLASHIATHMEVAAIVNARGELEAELQAGTASNVKRYFSRSGTNEFESPYFILDTVEMKTAWHPIGF